MEKIYVITAYKFGKRENHSYLVGVFSKKHKAIIEAEKHTDYRGGKYSCVIEECVVNEPNQCKEIYKTKI